MASLRAERVGRQILQEVSKIAESDLGDPRLDLVTFTEVKVTPDLRQARVFFSSLGDDAAREDVERALVKAKGYIRRELGRRLSLRYVPDLRFTLDDSSEVADNIARLLSDNLKKPTDADEE